MELKEAIKKLEELQQKQYAYQHVSSIVYLDATTVAPKGTAEGRGVALGILAGEEHKLFANEEVGRLLTFLDEHKEELDFLHRRQVEELKRNYEQLCRIPIEEYMAYSQLVNEAGDVWHKAKENNDFASFAPVLEKVVEFNRKFAGYYDATKKPYDALLNEYERGLDTETLDKFFAALRSSIVPLLAKVTAAPAIDDSFLHQHWPVEKQRELSDYLMQVMGIDRNYCGIAETEHPYTLNTNNRDVRITTHYYPEDFTFSMYSVIHEGGHALYELGTADELRYTCLTSMAMSVHESQSRFYENIIGRSKPFIHAIFPKLKELFPAQMENVTADMLYRAVNKAQPSLIRTEADELTYALHVMVRYELEKKLIAGELAVKDIPQAWNALYKEYLGVDVPDDKRGCLQDSHWSGGSLGYFPSYALGSAYGAQMLAAMEKDIDIWTGVEKGDLSAVTGWLREKIHRHGSTLTPAQLLENACGASFGPQFYVDYLTKKYTELYDL